MTSPGRGDGGMGHSLQAHPLPSHQQASLKPKDQAALDAYLESLNILGFRLQAVGLAVGTALTWASDFVVHTDTAVIAAFGTWRATVILGCLGIYLLLHPLGSAWQGKLWFPLVGLGTFLLALVTGNLVGGLGGLNHSYIHAIHALVGLSAWNMLEMGRRALFSLLLILGYLLGALALHPENLHHPQLPVFLTILSTAFVGYLVAGHLIQRAIRVNWIQRRTLRTQAAAIERAGQLTERLFALGGLNVPRLPRPSPSPSKENASALLSWQPIGIPTSQDLKGLHDVAVQRASTLGLKLRDRPGWGTVAIARGLTSKGTPEEMLIAFATSLAAWVQDENLPWELTFFVDRLPQSLPSHGVDGAPTQPQWGAHPHRRPPGTWIELSPRALPHVPSNAFVHSEPLDPRHPDQAQLHWLKIHHSRADAPLHPEANHG